ncbi:MSP domain-containing protein [Meloidogyne graminicola]|uniref:MSP domain-containing protein n=1 Tax=Meloidogyne graminicola TaxID=189291 RepID=A0A8S9ZVR9_9BILA|nr:MSP domain-containing protein [Meloidogyne graminicola]
MVSVEPAAIQVPAAGGNVSLQLMNGNAEVRFAFKLKSSNNTHYRVNPVFGFVEPGAAAQIEVIRQNGPPKGRRQARDLLRWGSS